MFVKAFGVLALLGKFEVYPKHVKEVDEEEFAIDLASDVLRKLLHVALVFRRLDGIVLVVEPVVIEECLDLLC